MKHLVLLLLLFLPLPCFSQKIREIEVIDTALVKVVYTRTIVTDTLNPTEKFIVDDISLFAGEKGSAFYSEKRRLDEELSLNPDYMMKLLESPEKFHAKASLPKDALFRDYTKNQCLENLRYDLASWQYQEEIEKPEWVIGDSVRNILGYDCIMATTDFRGRKWIAFFTPEIALPEGPWKLCGLPGMILEAHDDKNHYSYVAIGIETENIGTVDYFNYSDRYFVKNRKKGLQYRRKTLNIDIANKVRARTGLNFPSNPNLTKDKKNYDFEETDYPHE